VRKDMEIISGAAVGAGAAYLAWCWMRTL